MIINHTQYNTSVITNKNTVNYQNTIDEGGDIFYRYTIIRRRNAQILKTRINIVTTSSSPIKIRAIFITIINYH